LHLFVEKYNNDVVDVMAIFCVQIIRAIGSGYWPHFHGTVSRIQCAAGFPIRLYGILWIMSGFWKTQDGI